MKNFLSLYLDTKRIYIACMNPSRKGIMINYINASANPANLRDIASGKITEGLKEIKTMLDHAIRADFLSVTLPSSSALVTQIPRIDNMGKEVMQKLVNLELKHSFAYKPYEQVKANLIEVEWQSKEYYIAGVIPEELAAGAESLSKYLNISLNRLSIDHFSGHACYSYNYPERRDKMNAIVEVSNDFAEISFIKNNKMIYYNMLSIPYKEALKEKCKAELSRFQKEFGAIVNSVFIYGSGLVKEDYLSLRHELESMDIEILKLNPFRMLLPKLSESEKDFAARNAHIFPSCIGAIIPPYYNTITLN